MKIAKIILAPVITLLLVLSFSVTVSADQDKGRGNDMGRKSEKVTAQVQSCKAREAGLTTRMSQLTKLVTTMETTFDKIADRVKLYYSGTVQPSGKVVENYDALVSDITAKKAIVRLELESAKTNVSSFNCDSGEPKAVLSQFRQNMQSVKSALKNYRTSINSLIVAIRTVAK